MNATAAKAFGWLQFVVTSLGSVFANGVPHNALGWLGVLGSLATAAGIHASASTDGAK